MRSQLLMMLLFLSISAAMSAETKDLRVIDSVSYTHLDVYKRQEYGRAAADQVEVCS